MELLRDAQLFSVRGEGAPAPSETLGVGGLWRVRSCHPAAGANQGGARRSRRGTLHLTEAGMGGCGGRLELSGSPPSV